MRAREIVATVVVAAALVCGCSDSGSAKLDDATRNDALSAMQETGMTEKQAECVLDEMEKNLDSSDIELLTSVTDPNYDDQQLVERFTKIDDVAKAAAKKCGVPDDVVN